MKYLVTDQDATVKWIVEADDPMQAAFECNLEDYYTLVYDLPDPVWFERMYVERQQ